MVLLVKKGNPKHIQDWSDLVRDDVKVVFANPKTSANGRFAYLSALAYAEQHSDKPQDFMLRLLKKCAGFRGWGRAVPVFLLRSVISAMF